MYLDRISLSPNTRFDRICVSSAVICGGTTLSMIQYRYVVLFRTVTAETRRVFEKQKKKTGWDDGYMNGSRGAAPPPLSLSAIPAIPLPFSASLMAMVANRSPTERYACRSLKNALKIIPNKFPIAKPVIHSHDHLQLRGHIPHLETLLYSLMSS